MADASANRSAGRRRHRASSDSELAEGDAGGRWQQKWLLHEGLDVDQLARYRRRKVQGQPRDHLGCNAEREPDEDDDEDEEDARKRLVTEYRLAFRGSSDDVFHASSEARTPPSPTRPRRDRAPCGDSDKAQNGTAMDLAADVARRPAPVRRPTALRNEGDFSSRTEYSAFCAYPGLHRSELRRRGTSLRMEGEFDSRTEKNDKFLDWPAEFRRRPEPARLPANLRLEGELETSTECHEKYVPFVGARRPEILRQSAHLRLEGDSSWTPEYTDVFREYNFVERQHPKIPEANLKPGGGFYEKTEAKEFFANPRDKEAELMTELAKGAQEEEERKKREEHEEKNRAKQEEEMKLLVSKLEGLHGPPLEVPEYKDAYKDFPRERPKLAKPEDEIGRADGSKVPSATASPRRFKTKIDQDPEYKSIYLDSSRERPVFHRPPLSLRSSSRSSFARERRDSRRSDIQPALSEIRSQYVSYGQVPRTETMRMPANLRLEGNMDLEPEYRNAYRDHHQPRRRSRERSLSESRRNNNHWLDNDNGECFGTVNAAEDQDAFQVLHTRVHEESVVGKPPPGNRRTSRCSVARGSLQPDVSLTSDRLPQLRNRSPSPSYRLQVSNVDEEPRGFGHRLRPSPSQSLLVHTSDHRRSPSPIQAPAERAYSPSFARESPSVRLQQQQSFVVLDNRDDDNEPPRRRRTDHNFNPRESLASIRTSNRHTTRPRNKTPPNWMPPWYDSSTSTI
ncbi:serine/arginine repetitive matrix protein 2-like isoform X2 [Phymastichus coffea]|uniref:serine/arginine repetitive matrix protein 2-like isoform X2 n=1 Tax=Phymastichus coffea TaxID=108790 RepID=UPI00273BFDD0|nr:serine/arginine repetitive matrix protein 2-like isoform X2 [Phymastichus coffea]